VYWQSQRSTTIISIFLYVTRSVLANNVIICQDSFSSTLAATLRMFDGEVFALSTNAERQPTTSDNGIQVLGPTNTGSVYEVGILPVGGNDMPPIMTASGDGGKIVDYRQEWKELAHVMDRLNFWLMLVLMTISTLIIVLVPFYKNRFWLESVDDRRGAVSLTVFWWCLNHSKCLWSVAMCRHRFVSNAPLFTTIHDRTRSTV